MLPTITMPLFEVIIPSTKKKIKFRPYLVKEEKLLLIAQESGEYNDIMNVIKQIIKLCSQDTKIKVDELTIFDLEYIFLKIRSKSVNNIIKVVHKDVEDGKSYDLEVDLDKLEITYNKENEKKIKINEEFGLMMKFPSAVIFNELEKVKSSTDLTMLMIDNCIDKVYGKESVEEFKDYNKEQRQDFIDHLSIPTFEKIRKFFQTMPKLEYKITYKNSNDNEKEIVLSSLTDFFTWG